MLLPAENEQEVPDLGRSVLTEHWLARSSTSDAASNMAQADRLRRAAKAVRVFKTRAAHVRGRMSRRLGKSYTT